jgi:hypothetical protein
VRCAAARGRSRGSGRRPDGRLPLAMIGDVHHTLAITKPRFEVSTSTTTTGISSDENPPKGTTKSHGPNSEAR